MIRKTTRSILSVLLAVLLLVTSIPLTPAFAGEVGAVSLQSASGEGRALEKDDDGVYQIGSADELREFAERVNDDGETTASAVLTADIVLNEKIEVDENGTVTNQEDLSEWTPIGNSSSRYTGTFDGNGHTISGLYIDSTADDQGLFGYVGTGGTVQNLSVSGTVSGSLCVGGVVGDNRGSVENCYNTGSVTSSGSPVGGVVGYNDSGGSVTNCYNTGTVTGTDDYVGGVGGVVGWNISSGNVTNCYNTGAVSGGKYVGGVVGYNRGTVTGCYFLKQNGMNESLQGIGDGSGTTGATAVTTLDELCEIFKDDTTDTWTTSPFYNHPVLKTNPEGGDGTAAHPYEIKTAAQLKTFRDIVNGENNQTADPNAHAKLMNNIDLSSVCGESNSWTPIGNSIGKSYEGTFNGDGHTISGLYIDSDDNDYKGLFGRVNGGTVQDLTVSGNVSGDRYVGGVVGYNNGGTVTGCIFSGSGSVSGKSSVGGVVGENRYSNGVVENCHNAGKVSGSNTVGGVVGRNNSNGTVTNCTNTGNVSGPDSGIDSNVGGVVGDNRGSVENCYNIGEVSGDWYVGGIVGYNIDFDGYSASVENCYNTGSVSGSYYVGGVVGWNRSSVTNCYNTGSVSDGTYTGGVVGWNDGANVTNCYFLKTADVNENLSGIGKNEGTSSNVEAKTDDAFHSGEVAWLLENVQTDGSGQVWGQNIGEDKSPVLTSDQEKTVYRVPVDLNYTGAQADQVIYTNSTLNAKEPTREGYTFDGWYDSNGNPVTAITATTAKLYAHWTAVEDPDPEPEEPPYTGKYSYEVSTSVGDHGSLTVDRYATEGEKVTITVTPDEAYKLDDLSVTANGKDVELTAGGDGTYTFTMPSADVKISATFAEDPDWTEPEEPATDVSEIFTDIAPDAWYKDAIQYAYDQGLMTGVSATEFDPEATTTRAMIVSILARLEGVESAQAAGFADVDDEWYATAVNWAANVGVVNGYEDNTFRPNTAITREQLAAILMNYAAYKGEDVSNRADLTSYTDQPSTWAEEAMSWAVAEGLISGVTADTLQPQGAATRAQVAAILQRFLSE